MTSETPRDDQIAQQFEAEPEPTESSEEEDSPWATLVLGLVLIAGGIGLYWYFGNLEQEGGSVRLPALLIVIYETLGKTGILAILALLGAFMTWSGVSDLRKKSE